jgi:NAD(P)-dependent dehydrogenase (short-subunit alcohol dehydrogenase family)
MKHKDRVAVITGSASGMGRASALEFAKEGAQVVVADIDLETGEPRRARALPAVTVERAPAPVKLARDDPAPRTIDVEPVSSDAPSEKPRREDCEGERPKPLRAGFFGPGGEPGVDYR